ncbi:MAG: aminoacetone oxidase family FAD-binding enzyme, partial [Candidatus Hydrogenedentes bacterium]|nr:aminoacetone oxidase family FAD-binding enzyme [Candidatus Hydrogenedentota bacterium]
MKHSNKKTHLDVLVLGAGAAGMMCAIEAAKRGRRVVVLERNREMGEKIRISGGGRCNFTNIGAAPGCYVSENPRFCTSALARYSPRHFIELVERHKIAYHEKTLGQLFCDTSSREIIALLRNELAWAGGELRTGIEVGEVQRLDRYHVATSAGVFASETLVIATGGLSIPKMGATDLGYRIAHQFGLRIVPCAPGLVPFTWGPLERALYTDLSGISVDAAIRCNDREFRESFLFTHKGLSGPAILQISNYWNPGDNIEIDLVPETGPEALVAKKQVGSRAELGTLLAEWLPKRLALRLSDLQGFRGPVSELSDARLRHVMRALKRWEVRPAGTEGYAKAEVTRGGVDTAA